LLDANQASAKIAKMLAAETMLMIIKELSNFTLNPPEITNY
jgi:hypothetical protein